MRIAYISTKYCWDSYGILRSTFETLENLGHKVLWCKNAAATDGLELDMVFYMTSFSTPSKERLAEFRSRGITVVVFGLSDPNLFKDSRLSMCDVYCTNDMRLHEKHPETIWFPSSCDVRYHKHLDIPKGFDCVFVGVGKHPYVKNRQARVDKLRARGVRVVTYGKHWRKHLDSLQHATGDRMIGAINRAHLYIDLTSPTTSLGHRLFESSCCGTPVLTCRRPDTAKFFTEDKEVLYYEDGDFIDSTLRALSDKKKLSQVGLAARVRCHSEHDVKHRVIALIERLSTSSTCISPPNTL